MVAILNLYPVEAINELKAKFTVGMVSWRCSFTGIKQKELEKVLDEMETILKQNTIYKNNNGALAHPILFILEVLSIKPPVNKVPRRPLSPATKFLNFSRAFRSRIPRPMGPKN